MIVEITSPCVSGLPSIDTHEHVFPPPTGVITKEKWQLTNQSRRDTSTSPLTLLDVSGEEEADDEYESDDN